MKIEAKISRSVAIARTPRVQQLEGMFDVPPAKRSEQSWTHCLDLPDDWNVGVIVGPSGAGKSTLAREAFGKQLVEKWPWPKDKSIVDGFPKSMGIKDITGLLSSVGFSSPPSWLRPYAVLSNGEQFRVNLARTLAEMPDLAVIDEFTSVVDRTVAQIGSAAVAKAVRRRKQKFVAVTCHYDILDWLEPDWVYEPHTGELARGRLRRRPKIELEIVRVHSSAWKLFKQHHYLNAELHKASRCFVAFINGHPAAFTAVLPFPHPIRPGWREHRTVCLPDFQGVGIGNLMSEFVASLFCGLGKPYRSSTSHPSMIRHRARSPIWKVIKAPNLNPWSKGARERISWTDKSSLDRLTASFQFIGPARLEEAARFGIQAPQKSPVSRERVRA